MNLGSSVWTTEIGSIKELFEDKRGELEMEEMVKTPPITSEVEYDIKCTKGKKDNRFR